MKNLVLIGGGNHVTYCIDIIHKQKEYNIVGIIDSNKEIGTEILGYKVIGRQEEFSDLCYKYDIEKGLITIGDNWSREKVYEIINPKLRGNQDFWINAIHPSCIIGENVTLDQGIIAMAGVIINPGSKIGKFTFFATGAQIEHDCIIKDFASVSAGSIMGGYVTIGKGTAITLGVTIIDRLTIGDYTVIGSGSLVTHSIANNILAYGSPVKFIKHRASYEKFLK